ncbi:uncharacterized protein EKO05_0001947 [Ascochyta rabiei]|nr:uncharacterized protein EKO05_0001947 [Ascochyta rabiei]UPX11339.1 hypothetical protein EKO05_0001947 [Ascochyta rabiei]
MFFAILNLWLKDCNEHVNHKECQVTTKINLPTRLIDVGSQSKPSLRLVETAVDKVSSDVYIALSHPWGDVSKYKPFCTLREDPSKAGHDIRRFKQAIPKDQLPATFEDAVICTRRLGVQYLWIDSLCILQGDDGDFNEESKKMEDVYSGAYCVLAASRANSQKDGFLGPRPQREYVTFQRDAEKPFYVCKTIDHFSKDVIEGSLNKRGWVLQERALARRTIYFTENQTYFECGQGVRCETLTSMHNNMADFLGDPRFPDKAMRTPSKALKIAYFQELYKQYSRLGFSRPEDRPFGIAGLEKRLLNAYSTVGGYGVFDDGNDPNGGLFHRSLLWRRGEADGDTPEMVPIEFDERRNIHVPSWSWMAYIGGIQYADPPFQTATWETQDIIPPWTQGNIRHTSSIPDSGIVTITATVRKYVIAEGERNEAKLVFDRVRASGSDGHLSYCVIVARSNERRSGNRLRRFYVLLVEPTRKRNADGEQTYRRIGAGFMPGRYIDLDTGGTPARIV